MARKRCTTEQIIRKLREAEKDFYRIPLFPRLSNSLLKPLIYAIRGDNLETLKMRDEDYRAGAIRANLA